MITEKDKTVFWNNSEREILYRYHRNGPLGMTYKALNEYVTHLCSVWLSPFWRAFSLMPLKFEVDGSSGVVISFSVSYSTDTPFDPSWLTELYTIFFLHFWSVKCWPLGNLGQFPNRNSRWYTHSHYISSSLTELTENTLYVHCKYLVLVQFCFWLL